MFLNARPAPENSAYGVARVKAAEAFVALDSRLFDDPITLNLLPAFARLAVRNRWVRDRFTTRFEAGSPGIRGALLCRTRAIDDAVEAAAARGIGALVIIGAGFDTRAYRLPCLASATVVEIDLPSIQAFKKKRLLRRFGALPPNVRFVPLDLNCEPLESALRAGGVGRDERAIFVCEGVTQYLPRETVGSLCRAIAARPKGSEFVFTYVLEDVITGRLRAPCGEAAGNSAPPPPASWRFGIDPARLDAFLAGLGLTLCEDLGAQDYLARYVHPLGRDLTVSEIARIARAVV